MQCESGHDHKCEVITVVHQSMKESVNRPFGEEDLVYSITDFSNLKLAWVATWCDMTVVWGKITT